MSPCRRAVSLAGTGWPSAVPLLLAFSLAACTGPGYYFQAARGHFELMRARQDVDAVLADASTDPRLRERLELAADILAFARVRLDLPADDSYRTLLETHGEPVAWNVVATPEFSLEPKRWCFPVAGCVAYRGYFEQGSARSYADRLSEKGLDVAVTPVQAYSTLGWFEDPLLDSMLALRPAALAGTLIHELAHQRLYIRGDTEFNEAYASFVERAGVRAWLSHAGLELDQWHESVAATDQVSKLIRATRENLAQLYASDLDDAAKRAAKRAQFADLASRYQDLMNERFPGQGYFAGWFAGELNNARLALYTAYQGGHCAFAALWQESDRDFRQFHQRATSIADRSAAQRKAWLEQECPAVASAPEL